MANLLKTFNCFSHELIITKLHAYGFDQQALELMNNYLSRRKQKTKLDVHYSPVRVYFRVITAQYFLILFV